MSSKKETIINPPDSQEAKIAKNIIGYLITLDKYKFVRTKILAEIVHDTVKNFSALIK